MSNDAINKNGLSGIEDLVADEYKEYKSSRELFEECLKKSFSETGKQEFISIISNKFPELGRKISDHYDIDKLIYYFIDHCILNRQFEIAWSVIKEKRSAGYNEFFPQWNLAVQQEGRAESDYKNRQQKQPEQEDIVDWFFKKIDDPAVQSMVITAALFQGVERKTFNELAQNIHKLIWHSEQDVPRNEQPSLEEGKENSAQHEKKQVPASPPQLTDELEHLRTARLMFTSDKRNSDYGLTDIEIVTFKFDNYQCDILKLIKNNLYSKQPILFEFIRSLVDDESSEKRLFAVKAVIALSETHLFNDLLDQIIRKWAKEENYSAYQATASVLSGILLRGKMEKEILALLNSWLRIGTSISLNITSMFTYYLIADKYPEQALQAIEHVSEEKDVIFSRKSLDIAFRVYCRNRSQFISYLYDWITGDRPLLRQQAGRYFFRFIDFDDAVADQMTQEKTIVILSTLWKDRNMPNCLEMQRDTAGKVREWAEEALSALERDEKEKFLKYQTLFYELYRECAKKLDIYLKKWQEYREYKQQRALERGASSSSLTIAKQINFSLLIPTEE